VDEAGKIVREVKVASEPAALLQVLRAAAYHFKRIGLEAGPLSQWLFSALAEADLPVICVETRHMRAVLKAQINKTDRPVQQNGPYCHGPRFTISLKRSTQKYFSYPQAAGRLPHLCPQKRTLSLVHVHGACSPT
jgi:hypothetical protein